MLLMNRELRTKIPEQQKYTVPRNLKIRDRAHIRQKSGFMQIKLGQKHTGSSSVGQTVLVLRNQKEKFCIIGKTKFTEL